MPVIEDVTDEEALSLKEKGNREFKMGNFVAAEARFSDALRIAEDTGLITTLYCNRAQARLKMHCPETALADAGEALRLDPQNEKARYRKGRAELQLGSYEESAATFAELANSKDLAFREDAVAQREAALARAAEQREGRYDLPSLLALPLGGQTDVAEYLGPIKVAHVPGKGRGLVATEDVEAGELLFVNRAFCVAERNTLKDASTKRLATCSEPEFDAFFALGDKRSSPAELPPLLVRRGGGVSQPRTVDRARVGEILEANAHVLDTDPLTSSCASPASQHYALFLLGSLVNHSCCPSATRHFYGDLLALRAARPLRCGEEVTDRYVSVFYPCYERRQRLQEHYGFGLSDDRSIVEDSLLPEALVRPLLDRLDNLEDTDEVLAVAKEAEELVWDRLAWFGQGNAGAEVEAAASRLCFPHLDRMLLSSLLAAFVGVAAVLEKRGLCDEAAAAYLKCCQLLEGSAPNETYLVGFVVSALRLSKMAKRPAPPLDEVVQYARKAFRVYYGPGGLEAVFRASSGHTSWGRITAEDFERAPGELRLPPGAVNGWLRESDRSFEVLVEVGAATAGEVAIDAGPCVVTARVRDERVALALPARVRPDAAGAARIKKGVLRLVLPRLGEQEPR